MKWKPETFTIVAGTEDGYLTWWNLDSKLKNPTLADAPGGPIKIEQHGMRKTHQAVSKVTNLRK